MNKPPISWWGLAWRVPLAAVALLLVIYLIAERAAALHELEQRSRQIDTLLNTAERLERQAASDRRHLYTRASLERADLAQRQRRILARLTDLEHICKAPITSR